MFGISALSRTPFTSLPGNSYVFNRIEGFIVEADGTQSGDFYFTVLEDSYLADILDNPSGFFFSVLENSDSQDTISATADLLQSLNEALIASAAQTISAQFESSISEDNVMHSIESNGAVVYFSITEDSYLTDTVTISAGFTPSLGESFTSLANQSALSTFAVNRVEAMQIAEHLEAHGWIKIPDSQNANWQTITDTQTAGWTPIQDEQ